MNPETVKKLRETTPELQELIDFLRTEARKLNDLSALKDVPIDDLNKEVVGRYRAIDILAGILGPLLETVDKVDGVDPKEYVT